MTNQTQIQHKLLQLKILKIYLIHIHPGLILQNMKIKQILITLANHLKYRNVTDNPLFYLALVAIILGVQLFLAGFIGELLITNSDKTTDYKIKEEVS